jgi:hypothetical protein
MDPVTLQLAEAEFVAFVQTGALNVTAETGSPIAETGIVEPSFAAEQSASDMILSSPSEGKPDAWANKAEA